MNKKLPGSFAIISVVLLVIAGCAPASQPAVPAPAPGAPKAPAAVPTKAPAAPAAPEVKLPKRGGTFVFAGGTTTDPVGWAVTTIGGHAGQIVWNMISCNLVKWDNRPGHPTAATQVIPDLAESWENSTPTKYVFHIRKGVKTQTGKEVTATDVKWSLQLLKEKAPNEVKSWYGQIDPDKDLEIPDPYTIIFNLPKPDADFLVGQGGSYTRLYFNTKAEPSEDPLWKKWGGWYSGLSNVDGCGAWKGVAYQTASHIVFERRNDYWELGKDGKPLPYLDRIEHRFIFDHSAAIAALRAGQIMAIPEWFMLPLELTDQVARDNPGIMVDSQPGSRFWPIQWDHWAPPFNDIRVRRAISMATDREKWIKSQFNGRAKNVYGFTPVLGDWVLETDKMDPNKEGKWWRYNPQEAKKLLAEAGYPNGFEFNFTTSTPEGAVSAIEIFAGMMKKELNVKVNIVLQEYAAKSLKPSGMNTGWIIRTELKSYVWTLQNPRLLTVRSYGEARPYIPEDTPNVKEYTALVEKQQQTLDVGERKRLVKEMQRMGADNLWHFYFPVEERARLRYPYVKDYEPYNGWTWGELIYTWLDK